MKELKKSLTFYNSDMFIDNIIDVDTLICEYKRIAYEYGLIGNFNEEGNYSIKENRLDELLSVPKLLTSKTEYGMHASVTTPEFQLNFVVEKRLISDYQMYAALYIVEQCDDFYIEDGSLQTFIASYEDINDVFFDEKIKQAFNIFSDEDSLGKQKKAEEILVDITAKKLKCKHIESYIKTLMELQAELYVLRMLGALKKAGPVGEKALKDYNEKVKNKDAALSNPETKKIYSKLKKLLDDSVRENGGIKELGEGKEEAEKITEEYNNTFNESTKTAKEIIAKKGHETAKAVKKEQGKRAKGTSGGGSNRSSSKVGGSSDNEGSAKEEDKKYERSLAYQRGGGQGIDTESTKKVGAQSTKKVDGQETSENREAVSAYKKEIKERFSSEKRNNKTEEGKKDNEINGVILSEEEKDVFEVDLITEFMNKKEEKNRDPIQDIELAKPQEGEELNKEKNPKETEMEEFAKETMNMYKKGGKNPQKDEREFIQ